VRAEGRHRPLIGPAVDRQQARRDGKASRQSEPTPPARMLASVIECEGDEQRIMICDLIHSYSFGRLVPLYASRLPETTPGDDL
jgi:hypothetical protein